MHGSYYPPPPHHVGGPSSYAYTNGHVPNGTPRTAPTAATMNGGGPGFTFQTRHDRIDWRRMAAVDVDRVMRELDFATLQEVIMNVTFCDITAEVDARSTDTNFIKLFRLSQLIAEYLLHSQNYLTHSISLTNEKLRQSQEAQASAKSETGKVREELKKLKEECHKRKKMLQQQQNLIKAGANNYHKCPYCSKAFVHAAFLQSHVQRKHTEHLSPPVDTEAKKQREKLEHEMAELRERLHLTESKMDVEKRMLTEELAAQRESQSKEESRRLEELQRQQMETWKQEQLEMQRHEMERMEEMFMKEMKEMNSKYSSSQRTLEDLQAKYGKTSNLGVLQDEDEIADLKGALKRQKEENEGRTMELQDRLSSIQSSLHDNAKRFKEQAKQIKTDHKEEVKQLRRQVNEGKAALATVREGGSSEVKRYEKQMQQIVREFERQKSILREKDKEIHYLKSRPSKQSQLATGTPAIQPQLTSTPVARAPLTLEARKLDLQYTQTSPVKPPPSPKVDKPKPSLPAPLPSSSEEEEEDEEDESESEEEGEISMKDEPDGLDLKAQLAESLLRNLEKRGIPEGVKGITANSLDNKMKRMREERQVLARKFPKFYDIRKRLRETVDNKVKQGPLGTPRAISKRPKSTSPPHKSPAKQPKLKDKSRPIQTHRASVKGTGGSSRLVPPQVAPRSPKMKPKSSSLKSGVRIPSSPAKVSFEVSNGDQDYDDDDDDEEDDDEGTDDEEDSDFSMDEDRPNHQPARSPPTQPGLSADQLAARGTAEGMDDGSDWDSEDISELSSDQQKPGRDSRPMPAGRPKSPGIARMAESIERQLSLRRSDHKPVGGVDLGGTQGRSNNLGVTTRDKDRSPSPRIPTLPDASDDDDDDDDDDRLLTISSLEESNHSVPTSKSTPVPVPRQGGKPPAPSGGGGSRKSESDASNTYGTSMWGSSSKGQGESGTAKSSLVSVTDIDDDDFDISDL